MVWWGPDQGRLFSRIVIAMLSGWLISWSGVAALIALSVAWPHDSVPRVLLLAWAVLAAASLVIPGVGRKFSWPVLVLGFPFVPFLRAAVGVWPHLPEAVQDFFEGSFRRRRRARQQRKQAR